MYEEEIISTYTWGAWTIVFSALEEDFEPDFDDPEALAWVQGERDGGTRLMAQIEKSLDASVAAYDYDSDPHIKRASAVIVGDIFDAAWGHEQTNIDFYQVVKVTERMVALRQIDKKTARQKSDMVRTVMPIANKFTGPVIRKKLDSYNGRAMVRLNSYSFAYKWDGKEKTETSYG